MSDQKTDLRSTKEIFDNLLRGYGFEPVGPADCPRFPHFHVYSHREDHVFRLYHGRKVLWFLLDRKTDKLASGVGEDPAKRTLKLWFRKKP